MICFLILIYIFVHSTITHSIPILIHLFSYGSSLPIVGISVYSGLFVLSPLSSFLFRASNHLLSTLTLLIFHLSLQSFYLGRLSSVTLSQVVAYIDLFYLSQVQSTIWIFLTFSLHYSHHLPV